MTIQKWNSCLTDEDALERVKEMRAGVFYEPTREYLHALRGYLNEFMTRLNQKIEETSERYEVWDSEYFGLNSDTQEVVFSGTKEQCEKWISDYDLPRYSMAKAGCD